MSVPKRRRSSSKQARHRSSWKLKQPFFVNCSHCQSAVLSHCVCMQCGYYDGRKVMEIETQQEKKLRQKRKT